MAVANGVVYFQSMLDGKLYALDAKTGGVLAEVATGGQSSGPAVSRGQIYLGTGDSAFPFLNPTLPIGPGSLMALGLGRAQEHGRDAPEAQAAPAASAPNTAAAPTRPFQGSGAGSFVNGSLDFLARGVATHLGNFTHSGTLQLTPTADPSVFAISDRSEYTAANGDKLYAVLSATLDVLTGAVSGTDTWDGGTGRFADASGVVDISAQLLPDGSVTFSVVGNIAF